MTNPPLPPLADPAVMPSTPVVSTHTEWGLLSVAGADAVAFLHAQLSSDVKALGPGGGQYWSYNSPKGRMLANGVLWRAPLRDDAVVLLLAADLAETIRRRLAMFVLRAKVRVDDVTAAHALLGLAGGGAAQAAHEALGVRVPAASAAAAFGSEATLFALPDGRYAIVAPAPQGAIIHAALARHASIVDADGWRWLGIAAGVPWIGAATSDQFVPQMANWDVLGGVSFSKGCYPGQEIVARMQYLGRLKERLFAFRTDAFDVAAGARLYSAAFGADQPCGSVVNAAPHPSGGVALLAVAQIAAADAGDLALGAADGPRLRRHALPYAVPAPART
jgi:folate-binding protein YgfZ